MEKYSNSGHPTTHFAKLGQQPNNWPNSCPASLPSSNTNTQNVGPAPAHCRAPAHRPSYTLPYRRRNRATSSLPPAASPPSPVLRLPHPLLFYARQTLKTPTPPATSNPNPNPAIASTTTPTGVSFAVGCSTHHPPINEREESGDTLLEPVDPRRRRRHPPLRHDTILRVWVWECV
jgi:hypothetical protein